MKQIQIMKNIFYFIIWILFFLGIISTHIFAADLNINLVAVNASETEKKTISVKYFLPKELDPEDIVDAGILKLDYDVNRGSYYVYGDVEFNPKETKTFKVKIKDVWRVTQEDIDIIKKQIDENLALLEGKDSYEDAQRARDRMTEQLDLILAQQANYSEDIARRIEEYRAYATTLEDIRAKAFSLEYFEKETKGYQEENLKTVKLRLEVQNPVDQEKEVVQKHYLPEEIRAEHVVDSKGFEVRFDDEKAKAYLTKKEIFKPLETKNYEIILKDIWFIPEGQVTALEERANAAMEEIKDSDFAKSGEFVFDRVVSQLQRVRDSQAVPEESIKKHIGIFRVNEDRMREAKEDVLRLEQMLAIVRAKKLEELESKKVENVLQKLQALRGIAALAEAIFQKKLSKTMTWKIIIGTLIFIVVFTGLHFFIWWRRSRVMGEGAGIKPGELIKEAPKPGQTAPEAEEVKKK